MGYSERYCGYVDILGFRQLISIVSRSDDGWQEVRSLLEGLHNPPSEPKGLAKAAQSDLKVQSISDAIAISCLPEPAALLHMLAVLEEVTLTFLKGGFFVRGAIVKGRLYHDDKMVFGEALTEAYRLESETVRFPRIMISRTIATEVVEHQQLGDRFKRLLQRAEDGPYFLHVLGILSGDFGLLKTSAVNDRIERFAECGRQLQQRFDESVDVPRHFEKVQWFARYWNESISGLSFREIKPISGPGLQPLKEVRQRLDTLDKEQRNFRSEVQRAFQQLQKELQQIFRRTIVR